MRRDKKINFTIFTAVVMTAVFFAGCGSLSDGQNSANEANSPHEHIFSEATCDKQPTCSICGYAEGDTLPHDWTEATFEAPKTCKVCGATEGEALKKLKISDWAYDRIIFVNSETLLVNKGKDYFLVDAEGNRPDTIKVGEDTLTNSFYVIWSGFEGGAICLVQKSGSNYNSYLVDSSLELIDKKLNVNGYIYAYRDGVIMFNDFSNHHIKIYSPDYGEKLIKSTSTVGGVSYGYFYTIDTNAQTASEYAKLYKLNTNDEGLSIDNVAFEYGGGVIAPKSCPNYEGWLLCEYYEKEENSFQPYGGQGPKGFFNIKTGTFSPWPEDAISAKFFNDSNYYTNYVIGGKAVLSGDQEKLEDGSVWSPCRFFDLEKGEYVNEDLYKKVNLSYMTSPYMVGITKENKAVYISKSTYERTEHVYDLATEFVNGYALVSKDGETYLINDSFEIASDKLPAATSISTAIQYYEVNSTNLGISRQQVYFYEDEAGTHLLTTGDTDQKTLLSDAVAEAVHEHTFTDATCLKRSECTICRMKTGTYSKHDYGDTTDNETKVCKVCGETFSHTYAYTYTYKEPEIVERSGYEYGLLDLVNADRAATNGSSPLVWDDALAAEAAARIPVVSYNMANGIYPHDGKGSWYGENIAYAWNYPGYTMQEVNQGWINSQVHHTNRTTSYYTRYGAAYYTDGKGYWVYVELFGM